MSDQDFSLDDLVKAHRRGVGLEPARSSLNRSALLARVAGAATAGVVGSATSAAAATGTFAGGALLKLVLAATLLGAASGGYLLLQPSASSPLPPSQPASSPTSPAAVLAGPAPASEPAVPVTQEPLAAEPSRKLATPLQSSAPKPESSPVKGPEPSLSDDVRLMQQVGQALKGGNAAQALELLNQAPSQDSSGMREEKAAARVVTLCQLGRVADARAEAALFQKKYPRSPLATRVQSSCAKPGAVN